MILTLVRLASPRLRQEATCRMAAFVFSVESLKAPLQNLETAAWSDRQILSLCCEGR